MLTSLRIQNFRSIRDASVKLGQVNLFIGPNNSGKSNFLKGMELCSTTVKDYPNTPIISLDYYLSILSRILVNRHELSFLDESEAIAFEFNVDKPKMYSGSILIYNISEIFSNPKIGTHLKTVEAKDEASTFYALRRDLLSLIIYKPDPAKFQSASPIASESMVDADGSNLVSFLFYLSQNHKSKFRQLEDDLGRCVGDLISISTPADPVEAGKLKLKFFDHKDNSYWADEVSEGVLYFLALLCIVHQPAPPKLLLLEEPEKGIHPRRIREVMDFIFELARLRDIQIILTSHSPYVVDHFKDIPECISVFDRENGETVIRNAGDIITETNDKLVAAGKEPIRYTDSLGEHWVSGFLGGVPV